MQKLLFGGTVCVQEEEWLDTSVRSIDKSKKIKVVRVEGFKVFKVLVTDLSTSGHETERG